jgi:hypothetical protein
LVLVVVVHDGVYDGHLFDHVGRDFAELIVVVVETVRAAFSPFRFHVSWFPPYMRTTGSFGRCKLSIAALRTRPKLNVAFRQ